MTAILVLGAPVTAALQLAASGTLPSVSVLLGLGLILAAVAALVVQVFAHRRVEPAPVPAASFGA